MDGGQKRLSRTLSRLQRERLDMFIDEYMKSMQYEAGADGVSSAPSTQVPQEEVMNSSGTVRLGCKLRGGRARRVAGGRRTSRASPTSESSVGAELYSPSADTVRTAPLIRCVCETPTALLPPGAGFPKGAPDAKERVVAQLVECPTCGIFFHRACASLNYETKMLPGMSGAQIMESLCAKCKDLSFPLSPASSVFENVNTLNGLLKRGRGKRFRKDGVDRGLTTESAAHADAQRRKWSAPDIHSPLTGNGVEAAPSVTKRCVLTEVADEAPTPTGLIPILQALLLLLVEDTVNRFNRAANKDSGSKKVKTLEVVFVPPLENETMLPVFSEGCKKKSDSYNLPVYRNGISLSSAYNTGIGVSEGTQGSISAVYPEQERTRNPSGFSIIDTRDESSSVMRGYRNPLTKRMVNQSLFRCCDSAIENTTFNESYPKYILDELYNNYDQDVKARPPDNSQLGKDGTEINCYIQGTFFAVRSTEVSKTVNKNESFLHVTKSKREVASFVVTNGMDEYSNIKTTVSMMRGLIKKKGTTGGDRGTNRSDDADELHRIPLTLKNYRSILHMSPGKTVSAAELNRLCNEYYLNSTFNNSIYNRIYITPFMRMMAACFQSATSVETPTRSRARNGAASGSPTISDISDADGRFFGYSFQGTHKMDDGTKLITPVNHSPLPSSQGSAPVVPQSLHAPLDAFIHLTLISTNKRYLRQQLAKRLILIEMLRWLLRGGNQNRSCFYLNAAMERVQKTFRGGLNSVSGDRKNSSSEDEFLVDITNKKLGDSTLYSDVSFPMGDPSCRHNSNNYLLKPAKLLDVATQYDSEEEDDDTVVPVRESVKHTSSDNVHKKPRTVRLVAGEREESSRLAGALPPSMSNGTGTGEDSINSTGKKSEAETEVNGTASLVSPFDEKREIVCVVNNAAKKLYQRLMFYEVFPSKGYYYYDYRTTSAVPNTEIADKDAFIFPQLTEIITSSRECFSGRAMANVNTLETVRLSLQEMLLSSPYNSLYYYHKKRNYMEKVKEDIAIGTSFPLQGILYDRVLDWLSTGHIQGGRIVKFSILKKQ